MKASTLKQAIFRRTHAESRTGETSFASVDDVWGHAWRGAEKQNRSTPLALPIRCPPRGQVWLEGGVDEMTPLDGADPPIRGNLRPIGLLICSAYAGTEVAPGAKTDTINSICR
jgi:hypothetical protein